jgi:hypothetical protein
MSRQPARTALRFILVLLSVAQPLVNGGEKQTEPGAAEKEARDALVRFDKGWRPYTNEPNLGDPRWKLKMEVLVRLAQAGPAAFPLLEEAAKKGSEWSLSTRELADESLGLLRKAELRKALADYELTQMDSARVGKLAPDFALKEATGKTYRLSQFRDKKIVVLAFILADT